MRRAILAGTSRRKLQASVPKMPFGLRIASYIVPLLKPQDSRILTKIQGEVDVSKMADTGKQMLAALCLVVSCLCVAEAQLTPNYYQKTCPTAESVIKQQVTNAYNADKTIPAGLIRMFFHDCFVRGCDASVLIDGLDTEKQGVPNINSLRGFEVLDAAKAAVEKVCPGVVSCADVIAYAARDAMELAGNLKVNNWVGGRRDGSVSVSAETLTNLPSPFANFTTLLKTFQSKGLNQNDLVILSGAHSIGHAKCGIIFSRIWSFGGVPGQADPAIDPSYLPTLRNACPQNSPGLTINMDQRTPEVLDVNYFRDVNNGRGLFISDNALRTSPIANALVKIYQVPQVFSPSFVNSMRRMGNIGVLTGSQGKIKTNCRVA
ncbi:hypothetical protein R1flu_026958 [Riccia fluitans]|uniref:Peroxidase n=1 Tax=Riccia fluitans TaxID=41844 RepID=A0ABD1XHH7_9MARC